MSLFERGLTKRELAALRQQAAERLERRQRSGLLPEGKYTVLRNDGRDLAGEKHEQCWYFVLDVTHDPYAVPALEAYADACRIEHPQLAFDLQMKAAAAGRQEGADAKD